MALLSVAEALARLLDGAGPLDAEAVAIGRAAGRVLAGPVIARRTQPPFPASAMDGYAVRSDDLGIVPAQLRVIGEAAAGHAFSGSVGAGETVRIFTGAPVPPGADAVLIQENATALDGGQIEARESVARGRHIRAAGLDFSEGALLLQLGRVLDAAAVSLAAAGNCAELSVVRRPRVAILATGDELVPPGGSPGPDQIIASNGYGIGALVAAAGGEPLDLGIVSDRIEAITAAVDRAVAAGADILVTLGGVSVGDHDLVRNALADRGMTLDFWKIAIRPGKPLMFGRLGPMRVLGLPGNPVSSLVCGHVFLMPLVAALAGIPHAQDMRDARLGVDMSENDVRQDYVRAEVRPDADGSLVARPFAVQDSSMLSVLGNANALIIRPPHAPASPAGSLCRVLMLR
jgi:molybdopterin molybdotransferase